MTGEIHDLTCAELLERRRDILARLHGGDLDELREPADSHAVTPDERDLLLALEEVDLLPGDDA